MANRIHRRAAVGRSAKATPFAIALGLSMLVHGVLAPRLLVKPENSGLQVRLPLTATLAPSPDIEPAGPAITHPESRKPAREVGTRRKAPELRAQRGDDIDEGATAHASLFSPASGGGADRYYTAEELDVYPRPRRSLRRELRDVPAAAVRLLAQISVNEQGGVDEVTIAADEAPPAMQKTVQAVLRAARFFPALKDGRPVRSRILMRVEWDVDAHSTARRAPAVTSH